jgi:hypothetical protein
MVYIHKMIQGFHAANRSVKSAGWRWRSAITRLQISVKAKVVQLFSFFFFFFFFLLRQEVYLVARVDINGPRDRVATRQGCHETGLPAEPPNEDVGMNRVRIDPE